MSKDTPITAAQERSKQAWKALPEDRRKKIIKCSFTNSVWEDGYETAFMEALKDKQRIEELESALINLMEAISHREQMKDAGAGVRDEAEIIASKAWAKAKRILTKKLKL